MEWFIQANGIVENIPNYDCRNSRRESGSENRLIGVSFILYGLITEILYIIVMIVMLQKQQRQLSCYKIMIFLGAFDMMGIYFNSLLSGYLFIVGGNYCYSPAMIFVSGTVALGLWCGTCLNCLLLVTNRLMDLWNRRVMEMLFHGHRTYIILMVPIFYSLYFTFFTPPIIFNSDHMAWFFATFTPDSNIDMFYNYPHTCNNVFVVAITCLLYVVYSKVLLRHSKIDNGLTWAQKSFFIQSSLICMLNLVGSLIYVYMQFIPTPPYFIFIGHLCWQLSNGFPAFVYIFLNKTIQRGVLQLLKVHQPSISVKQKPFISTRTTRTIT